MESKLRNRSSKFVDIPGDTEYYFNIENVTAGQFDEGKKPLKASVDSKEIPVTIIDPFVVIFFIIVFSMVGFLKTVKIKTSLLAYFCKGCREI